MNYSALKMILIFSLFSVHAALADQTCKSESWTVRSINPDPDAKNPLQDITVTGQICIDWEVRNEKVAKVTNYRQVVDGRWSPAIVLFTNDNTKDLDNICKRIAYHKAIAYRIGSAYDFYATPSSRILNWSPFHEFTEGGLFSVDTAYPASLFCKK